MNKTAKKYDIVIVTGLAAISAGLIIYPAEMVSAAKSGLDLCFDSVIPALFPFFVISSLIISLGYIESLGKAISPLTKKLFHLGGSCGAAAVIGLIGGYPVGARATVELYKDGGCTKEDAEKLIAFSNNSGPAFIMGAAGAGVFHSAKYGALLMIVHVISAIVVGALAARRGGVSPETAAKTRGQRQRTGFFPAFVNAVTGSFMSCLSLCGFVTFFSVFTALVSKLASLPPPADVVLTGLLELTGGIWGLRDYAAERFALPLASLMLGWGGLSVHFQALSFITETDVSPVPYFAGKFMHGIISCAVMCVLARVIG